MCPKPWAGISEAVRTKSGVEPAGSAVIMVDEVNLPLRRDCLLPPVWQRQVSNSACRTGYRVLKGHK